MLSKITSDATYLMR